jgi:hypothetical protein
VVEAADRHPGQEGYSLNPPREVGDEDPVYEQIQAKKVKARLRMLEQAQRVSGNVSQTLPLFRGPRALFYIRKKRYFHRCPSCREGVPS